MKMSSEKKKIFGVILSFLLVLSMSVPVMAEDENYPRYLDDAGLLSSSQAQKLEKKLDKISKEHHCDVVIAVANTTNGQDIESFTEDFYDSMGYGQGEKKSGIMLMVSMKERQWNMCTTGDAIDAFTDAGLDYIGETFITYLSDEKYNKAFTTFARLSDKFLNQAEKGKPYDSGHMPKGSVSPFWIFGDLAIGIFNHPRSHSSVHEPIRIHRQSETSWFCIFLSCHLLFPFLCISLALTLLTIHLIFL